jgi:hypothetical protein
MADTSTNSWKLLYEAGRQALQDRKLQEAEQSFSAALQLAEDFAGGDPRLAATLNALARIYSLQRRYLAAAALLNRLLEVTERTLGPTHVQVAGVLTNLAEMYTHLGAAREELELRERVLAIRGDDPNADAASLVRLRERVAELRSALAAQEPPAESDEDLEPLPVVRTAEYSSPIAVVEERAVADVASKPATPMASARAASVPMERDDAFRMSPATSQLSIAPWPGAAATGSTPVGGRTIESVEEAASYADAVPVPASSSGYETIPVYDQPTLAFRNTTDHGFSDMGRDELVAPFGQRFGGRTRLLSIAAGVVLVAGILAARSYVSGSDDERESAGSVSLANVSAPATVTPVSAPAATPDPRTVERMVADRQAERETKRLNDESRDGPRTVTSTEPRERAVVAPRVPTAADIERTLRNVEVAVKAIDQRTKAATDSASAIRLQDPTFKKVKIAEQP